MELSRLLPYRLRVPSIYWSKRFLGTLDSELFLVGDLVASRRRFVDIGANKGLYSWFFAKLFENVEAFEPVRDASICLAAMQIDNVQIHPVGLSSRDGRANINIPVSGSRAAFPLASIEARDGACLRQEIEIARLDSYGWEDVDLIKIDVEGHEHEVISGAAQTLREARPVVVCEIEARHRPDGSIQEVFGQFQNLGFAGFFLSQQKLRALAEFSVQSQLGNPSSRRYVNNFIFIPDERFKH